MTDTTLVSTSSIDERTHARRWIILVVLALAQLMVVLDSTVVNIALPTAQNALHFNDGDRQWIITAYSLAFGALLLFTGRLADLIGRKYALIIGLTGFAIASAVGGAATSFGMLVSARAVQGAFGAMLAPAVLALLTTTFTDGTERGRAFGVFGAIQGGGAAIGLLLGGVLTEYFSWRATMFVNIIIAVPALLGAIFLLIHRPADEKQRLDIWGAVTITVGLFALVYGFSHAESSNVAANPLTHTVAHNGWTDGVTLAYFVAALIFLVLFVIFELRVKHPLLPLRVLLDRDRGAGFITMFLASIGMFGVFLFMTYYLQANLGYSAVKTGVAFLPLPAALVVVAAILVPLLQRRVSPKYLVPVGALIGAAGLALETRIGITANYASDILPGLILLGIGMGLIFSISMSVATLGIQREDAGVVSAVANTMQQVGGSIGTALLNTLAAGVVSTYVIAHAAQATSADAAKAVVIAGNVHSYQIAFWISAAIFAGAAVITFLLLRRGVPAGFLDHDDEDAAPVVMH